MQAGSRETNDVAQILFALYVSVGITAATRQNAHLAIDIVERRYSEAVRRRIALAATLLSVVPWTSFVIYAAWPGVVQSVRELERFPDTYNPGYFVLRLAVGVLALLALAQAVLALFIPDKRRP